MQKEFHEAGLDASNDGCPICLNIILEADKFYYPCKHWTCLTCLAKQNILTPKLYSVEGLTFNYPYQFCSLCKEEFIFSRNPVYGEDGRWVKIEDGLSRVEKDSIKKAKRDRLAREERLRIEEEAQINNDYANDTSSVSASSEYEFYDITTPQNNYEEPTAPHRPANSIPEGMVIPATQE